MYPEIDVSLIMRVPEDRKISNYPGGFPVEPFFFFFFRPEFFFCGKAKESESSTMMQIRDWC